MASPAEQTNQCGFQILDTWRASHAKFRISDAPSPVKIGEEWATCLSQNEIQLSMLKMEFSNF